MFKQVINYPFCLLPTGLTRKRSSPLCRWCLILVSLVSVVRPSNTCAAAFSPTPLKERLRITWLRSYRDRVSTGEERLTICYSFIRTRFLIRLCGYSDNDFLCLYAYRCINRYWIWKSDDMLSSLNVHTKCAPPKSDCGC